MNKKKKTITLEPPLSRKEVRKLNAGDLVKISGKIITARDKAYEKILTILENNQKLPFDLEKQIIYHCGPLAKQKNKKWKVVAAGPTTSARLDNIQLEFVEKTGVRALIGKGGVNEEVAQGLGPLDCLYLAFTGGAAALAAESIVEVIDLYWEELGTAEAVWLLKVEDFGPLTVGVNTNGENLYVKK